MRVRIHPSVAKQVNVHRKTLTANAEVNRALDEYYTTKKANQALLKKPHAS